MIICSCLNISSKDIEDLLEKKVVSSVKDVYTSSQQGDTDGTLVHSPCSCCPKMIKQYLEE